ncbi:MAG: F0F1 ATP synthase subunit beta, partial [Planctomycetia bacterium]
MSTTLEQTSSGTIAQIFGPVVDVRFPAGKLPPIYPALHSKNPSGGDTLVLEVAAHLGNDTARCVAMASTDGFRRGMSVANTGGPIA